MIWRQDPNIKVLSVLNTLFARHWTWSLWFLTLAWLLVPDRLAWVFQKISWDFTPAHGSSLHRIVRETKKKKHMQELDELECHASERDRRRMAKLVWATEIYRNSNNRSLQAWREKEKKTLQTNSTDRLQFPKTIWLPLLSAKNNLWSSAVLFWWGRSHRSLVFLSIADRIRAWRGGLQLRQIHLQVSACYVRYFSAHHGGKGWFWEPPCQLGKKKKQPGYSPLTSLPSWSSWPVPAWLSALRCCCMISWLDYTHMHRQKRCS